MADAAMVVLDLSQETTGPTFLDVEVLRSAGVTYLARYGGCDNPELYFFVDELSQPTATS